MNCAHTATVPLVLLRHAQSTWNLENRFTGWADVGLTEAGRAEAHRAAVLLRGHDYRFDRAFVSQLRRSTETLEIVLHDLAQDALPVERSWRLNERHYGALEGLDKTAYAATHGAQQLERVRRSLYERPPPLSPDDARYRRQRNAYPDLDPALLPVTESLADTAARLWPYWEAAIAPAIARGERLLVVTHGNTLRALVMRLENMPEDDVEHFVIPTGIPLIVEFAPGGKPRRYYLDNTASAVQTLSIKQ